MAYFADPFHDQLECCVRSAWNCTSHPWEGRRVLSAPQYLVIPRASQFHPLKSHQNARKCSVNSESVRVPCVVLSRKALARSGWYAPAVSAVPGVHSWRVGADCDEWGNIYEVSRTMEGLGDYAGPGRGYNDPDMLVGTSGASSVRLTPTQSRTQFLLWAVMAAPLLLGTAPGDMNAWDFETYSNEAVIAIDQDPLGVQGAVVQSDCPAHAPKDNWWCSPWSMPRDVADVWTSLLFTVAAVVAATAALLGLAVVPATGFG